MLQRVLLRRALAARASTRASSGGGQSGRRFDFGSTSLSDFLPSATSESASAAADEALVLVAPPYLERQLRDESRTYHIETYGCQMNVADSELVHSILQSAGFVRVGDVADADVVLLNTCAIRDKAEARIWSRLRQLRAPTAARKGRVTIGLLGCMAERLKERLLEHDRLVDVVCGPDAYRALPRLLADVSGEDGATAINVQLSVDETYADIAPVRESSNGVSAFVTIMRGCNNHCSFCIVPRTRGRERSRDPATIVRECVELYARGYREVTLLGQNVNTYNFVAGATAAAAAPDAVADAADEPLLPRPGFKTNYSPPLKGTTFAALVDELSAAAPNLRIRFTSPHPKDFPDELIDLVRSRPNVCAQLHVPAQSGSTSMLERMRRGYSRETYLDLVAHIRRRVPGVALSTDMISGFCGETADEHADTVSLMRAVAFEQAFMFAYSMREKTPAHRRYADDVPLDVKKARLAEVIDTFRPLAHQRNLGEVGLLQTILIEDRSRRSDQEWTGRSDRNRKVVVGERALPLLHDALSVADAQRLLAAIERGEPTPSLDVAPIALGQFVICRATSASGAVTLRATPIARVHSLALASALTASDIPRFAAAEQPQAATEAASPRRQSQFA
jgi:tRNA A37 methylthiotransferase MiaB